MPGAARGHWPFALVLSAGLALRVLTEVAYRPALLYIDSAKYLVGSRGTTPEGYQVLLRLLDPVGGLALVAAVQHAFGLAVAIAVYALLIRHQVPRWAATLAAAPVLLDGYQLQLEQTVMPDVLFETMIAGGLVLLLWPRPPGQKAKPGTGRGGRAPARRHRHRPRDRRGPHPARRCLRRGDRVRLAAAHGPGHAGHGLFRAARPRLHGRGVLRHRALRTGQQRAGPAYGRAAVAAYCASLTLPADERALCPAPARTLALGGIDGLLHNPQSPGHTVPVPPGATRAQLLAGFSLAVFRQQPLRVAASVARDSVRLFALTRDGDPEITNIARWQFQTFYPTYPHRGTMAAFTRLARQHGSGGDLVAVKPAATVLRDYQLGGGYTPGPLYAIGLVAGLLGSLCGLARRRTLVAEPRMLTAADSELAAACLLVTLSAIVLLLSSDAYEFSWRYQLPAVVMLPVAGALGLTALAGRIKRARASTAALTAVQTSTGGTGRRTRPASAASGPQAPADR